MKPAAQSRPTKGAPRLHVLLVDDHPAVREGLGLLLTPEGIEVCGEAAGRGDALAVLAMRRPDLAIVDLSLDGEDGVALIAELTQRGIPVLVYSMHNDPLHVRSALAAGALGYVTKRVLHGVLVQAIRDVAAGRRFVSPVAAAALAETVKESSGVDVERLSPHEHRVYELLGQGADTFDIAAALHISHRTVESYYSRILVKFNLNGMHELRRHAIAHLQQRTT